jgi:hypothetical protein
MERIPIANRQEALETLSVESDATSERYWPLINDEESKFIEDNGGEYHGFVSKEHGRQEFEDFRVRKVAYYEQHERAVMELFVAVDGMNAEGSELLGASEVTRFTLMILRRLHDGKLGELGDPEIISLRPEEFSGTSVSTADLRHIAYEIQNLAIENAHRLQNTTLRKYVID